MTNASTDTKERALKLLGDGIGAEIVAMAVGVSVSMISQYCADPEFSKSVAELRYKNLSKHTERDGKYDNLEDKLLERMETLLPMMYKSGEVLKALQIVNMAKRRGVTTPESLIGQKEVVTLTMPQVVLNQFNQQFITNVNNQVIKAGDQDLVTVQSVRMNELLKARKLVLETMRAKNVSDTIIDANTGVLESR